MSLSNAKRKEQVKEMFETLMSNIQKLDRNTKNFRLLWVRSILFSMMDIMEKEKKL